MHRANALAVCINGTLWSWGWNVHGVSGDGTAGFTMGGRPEFPLIWRTVPSPTNTMKVTGMPAGVTLQGPLFLEDDGSGELTLHVAETVPPGEYNLNLFIRGVTCDGFTLTINNAFDPPPIITINAHPADTNVVYGEIDGELSVTASVTNDATLSYQWFSSTTASNTGGTAIPGANAATFPIPTDLPQNSTHFFYVVVSATSGAESVTSNVATVTVGFGTVPHTGIPNIAGMIAAMFVFLAVSVVSWGFVLRHKLRRNSA